MGESVLARLIWGAPDASACGSLGTKALRRMLAAGVAFAFILGTVVSADAARKRYKYYNYNYYNYKYYKHHKYRSAATLSGVKPNPERDGFADIPKGGVLQIAISTGSQRLHDVPRRGSGGAVAGVHRYLQESNPVGRVQRDREGPLASL